jgi:hypothetical protein
LTATDFWKYFYCFSNNVTDITAPNCILPQTSTIDCTATPAFAVAKATDACGSAFASADVTTNGDVLVRILLLELGPLLIHGNSSTASQTINVQDKRLQ